MAIDSITEDQILDFLGEHYSSSASNYNRALRTIKPVFKYAHDRGMIGYDPTHGIHLRDNKKRTEVLRIEEFNRIIQLIQTEEYKDVGNRDKEPSRLG